MADREPMLAEVWGEAVDLRNLGKALLIAVPVSLGGFLAAAAVLPGLVGTPATAKTYALLVGLFSTILGAVICAKLFKPQRIVTTEAAADSAVQAAALAELAASAEGLGDVTKLPEAVQAEMRELGVYDTFLEAQTVFGTESNPSATADQLIAARHAAVKTGVAGATTEEVDRGSNPA